MFLRRRTGNRAHHRGGGARGGDAHVDHTMNATPSYRGAFDLTGKVAVVTGGAGILGPHFCAGLAESGADVAVVDIQAEKAREVAESLHARFGRRAVGVGCDVS